MTRNNHHKDNNNHHSLSHAASRACKHIDIGTAVLQQPLQAESLYKATLQREFNAIVVEHDLKWGPLLGEGKNDLNDIRCLGQYDFTQADIVVNWALQHHKKIKGHVLVWHVTSPPCLQQLTADQLREHLQRHICTVMGYFRGRIRTWDVVNEALAPDGSLAENIFLQKLGPSYIEECFRWAHQADPDAVLLYNDNKVEAIDTPKGDAFYHLLADLKAKQVPIHGCGMQGHFNAAGTGRNRPPTPRMLKQQIRRLGDLGLTVNLSEVDVRTSRLENPVLETVAQKQIYHDLVVAALSEPSCDGIWLWGFTDKHTWVSHFYYDDQPLIFDEEYQRKPAYYALREAIASFGVGSVVGNGVLLEEDVDVHGNTWGHEWMLPEPEDEVEGAQKSDARPDWEQEDAGRVASVIEPTDLLSETNDNENGGADDHLLV
jgi:endo-1,4-beta-xylanase